MQVKPYLNTYKKKYLENGFVKIPGLVSKKEIFNIQKDIKKISTYLKKRNYKHLHLTDDNKVNTIHNLNKLKLNFYLKSFAKKKKIVSIINKILDTKQSTVRNLEFFLKPKRTGSNAPFHQDNYYWNVKNSEALNVWIACSKSNKYNGGLCYFNKSHKKGIYPHEISHAKGTSQKIEDKILKKLKYRKVYPSLKPGDCLIHHPQVVHGSHKNRSNFNRTGIVISYKKRTAKYDYKKIKIYKKKMNENFKSLNRSKN
tara:strand:+ start:4374 stop:5141 length:768 start_codon:yes stop_codon:yes gene_type:complete